MSANYKWPTPRKGEVHLCYFPYKEYPNDPGPKARPVIVLSVESKTFNEPQRVMVCYGTGQKSFYKDEQPYEFVINDGKYFAITGVVEPTCFDLKNHRILFYNKAWFHVPTSTNTISPRIGCIPKSLIEILKDKMRVAGLGYLLNE